MADTYQSSKTYQANADDLYLFCISAFKAINVNFEKGDKNLGIIQGKYFKTGLFFSDSIRLIVSIIPNDSNSSNVVVESFGLNTFGAPAPFQPKEKRKEVADNLFATLDFIVKRADVKR